MKKAKINLGYRIRLDDSISTRDNFYENYMYLKKQFISSMNRLKKIYNIDVNKYEDLLREDIKQSLYNELKKDFSNSWNSSYFNFPINDITNLFKIQFNTSDFLTFNIVNGSIDPPSLIIDLCFRSKELILLDSIEDKILVTTLTEKKEPNEFAFFIRLDENLFFANYKEI